MSPLKSHGFFSSPNGLRLSDPRRRKMLPSVEFSTKPWSRRLETTVKFTRLRDCCSTYKVEIIIYIYMIYMIYIYISTYIYIIHNNHSWYRACIPKHFLSPPSCPFVVALYRQPNHTPPAAVDPWKLRNPTSQVFFNGRHYHPPKKPWWFS